MTLETAIEGALISFDGGEFLVDLEHRVAISQNLESLSPAAVATLWLQREQDL